LRKQELSMLRILIERGKEYCGRSADGNIS